YTDAKQLQAFTEYLEATGASDIENLGRSSRSDDLPVALGMVSVGEKGGENISEEMGGITTSTHPTMSDYGSTTCSTGISATSHPRFIQYDTPLGTFIVIHPATAKSITVTPPDIHRFHTIARNIDRGTFSGPMELDYLIYAHAINTDDTQSDFQLFED